MTVSQAWSNEVFRVSTVTGAFAIKLFPPCLSTHRREQLTAGIEFEASVLPAGLVTMPRPVTVDEHWLIEVDTPRGVRFARCHEWVTGTPVTDRLDADLVRAAGRYLGVIHAMDRAGGDTSQLPRFDHARWERAVHGAVQCSLSWADRLADLTPLVRHLAAGLDVLRGQRRPMRLSHRDYDPKNTVIDASGRLVITDWDSAGPVLTATELVVAATSFGVTDADVRGFVQAYRRAGGNATPADQLALTAEVTDLDWLLRNIEACLVGDPDHTQEQHQTAADLIAALPAHIAALQGWADRSPQSTADYAAAFAPDGTSQRSRWCIGGRSV